VWLKLIATTVEVDNHTVTQTQNTYLGVIIVHNLGLHDTVNFLDATVSTYKQYYK